MARPRSRLARTEEKSNKKKAYLYIFLTIISLILLLFLGIPSIVKMASFLTELRSSGEPIGVEDTTPPAPPQMDELPEATNKSAMTISGTAESGATVVIYLNGEALETIADNSGEFSYTSGINKGENVVYALVRDSAGNESQTTQEYFIVFDNEAPDLDISSPEDGAEFFGSKQRQVSIEGATEENVKVTINERFVVVESDGTFTFTTTLNEGENGFSIKAEDNAGNQEEKTITLRFSE
jgi:hypothetical protein